jgi:hypothetical protein
MLRSARADTQRFLTAQMAVKVARGSWRVRSPATGHGTGRPAHGCAMNNHHHPPTTSASSSSKRPPTKAQLNYLRSLAMQRGETFANPQTFAQARGEIIRLKARRPMRRTDRRREDLALSRQMASGRGDAAAVDIERETRGYGSSAAWA